METYKAIFLLGLTVCYTFSGVPARDISASQVLGPVSDISAVPASAPTPSAPTVSFATAGGPASEDTSTLLLTTAPSPGPSKQNIDTDFNVINNMADITPKIAHINNFNYADMKIDTTARDLCTSTDYAKECIATILPDLNRQTIGGKSSFEPLDVMRMETLSLFKKANATLDYAKRLVEDSKTDEAVKEAMSVCIENYDSLVADLGEVEKAMDRGDYSRLESSISAAISDVSTCSDSFAEVPGLESPTASLNELIKKLCSNVLAMSQKVVKTR